MFNIIAALFLKVLNLYYYFNNQQLPKMTEMLLKVCLLRNIIDVLY